jgi:LSD1 subclass zinc finger protein
MPATPIACPGCAARLKAPEGKSKVRCPLCRAVVQVPGVVPGMGDVEVERQPSVSEARKRADSAEDVERREEVDHLEEVEEVQGRSIRRREWNDEEDDRPRRKRKRRKQQDGDGPWLIAIGVAGGCFVVTFFMTLLVFGFRGLPDNQEEGGYPMKLASLATAVVVALILVGMGVFGVKYKIVHGRWGDVVTGPFAVVLAMVITISGGCLGGFAVYTLLVAVLVGR